MDNGVESEDMDSNYSYLNKRYAEIFEPIHGSLIGMHYAYPLSPIGPSVISALH